MQPAIKWVVAIVVVALIAVIGLIVMTGGRQDGGEGEPAAVVTAEPEETVQPEDLTSPDPESADDEAQNEAQGTMYEGALAGLSEEEIAAMAIAEEESSARSENMSGAEGAVD